VGEATLSHGTGNMPFHLNLHHPSRSKDHNKTKTNDPKTRYATSRNNQSDSLRWGLTSYYYLGRVGISVSWTDGVSGGQSVG
jgi:hypothetical protein